MLPRTSVIDALWAPAGKGLTSWISIVMSNCEFVIFPFVTMYNTWNNRISDGCVYAQISKGLGMHRVTYTNHDTVPFLLIVQ